MNPAQRGMTSPSTVYCVSELANSLLERSRKEESRVSGLKAVNIAGIIFCQLWLPLFCLAVLDAVGSFPSWCCWTPRCCLHDLSMKLSMGTSRQSV